MGYFHTLVTRFDVHINLAHSWLVASAYVGINFEINIGMYS